MSHRLSTLIPLTLPLIKVSCLNIIMEEERILHFSIISSSKILFKQLTFINGKVSGRGEYNGGSARLYIYTIDTNGFVILLQIKQIA